MSDEFLDTKLIKPVDDVIIIDDEQSVIDVLEMYCENIGCFRNIITATDGAIGEKKLSNQKFSLILLDVNMPKRKGGEIIKEVAHETGLNKIDSICVVSGNINKGFLNDALAAGVKHYLVKPFTEEQFQEKTKAIMKTVNPKLFKQG